MSLAERIAEDLKTALKSRDAGRTSILRMIKSAVKNKEIDKMAPLSDEEVLALLRTFVKRAGESIEQFSKAGRQELVEKEKAELAVIQQYLPKQLSEEDVRKIIGDVITETGASGPRDMGSVMKAVMAKTRGQADGKLVNNLVKEMLEA
ncbi:MAG: GatB/YqeY domain-containing protein [Nitrospirota bacterium]|nr:GatB/YqeY domain-containing protein [Nitrospirota bacterium]